MFPQEKDVLEERISKPGERDDSLPPDHRFSEADKKVTNIVQYISIPTHSLKQFKQKKISYVLYRHLQKQRTNASNQRRY